MLLFRALFGVAMAAYILVVSNGSLDAVARVWALYAAADALAALLSMAALPPRHARSTSLLFQGVWSIGAALIGFLLPTQLLLLLFVVLPLWSVGSTVLTMAGLQQVRTTIEARWLLTILALVAATFAAVFLVAASGNTTWLRATLAAGGVASSVVFILTSLSLKAEPQH